MVSDRPRFPLREACLALFLVCMLAVQAGGRSVHAEVFDAGLLWEVRRPGVAPSFVFGTMHVADARVAQVPLAVEAVLARARILVLELYPDRAVTRRFSEGARFDDGSRLSQLLPASLFARVSRRLAERGMGGDDVDGLKPWAALLLVTAGDGGESLDGTLYRRARLAGKRVEELESVDEQLAVFDGLPLSTQVALLETALDRHDALRTELEENILAYLRGDLAGLAALARRNAGASEAAQRHFAVLEKRLIHDRSVVMAYRLEMHLRRGGALAAVGALHLYGRRGILQLLKDGGWQVRPAH